MSTEPLAFILAGLGAFVGAAIQYAFQRLSAERQQRREIIETTFLQLQDAVESLYYRLNNLRDWDGKHVMSEEYFRFTSVYVIGRVIAYENLLVSKGIYAKLHYDETLKRRLKSGLHRINHGLDDQHFLHYHRLQLAEALLKEDSVMSYTEFLSRAEEPPIRAVIGAAAGFIERAPAQVLDEIRTAASEVVQLLEAHTQVPSALTLAKDLPIHSSSPRKENPA